MATHSRSFFLTAIASAATCLAVGQVQAGTIYSEDFESWDGTTNASTPGANGVFSTGNTWPSTDFVLSTTGPSNLGSGNLLRPSATSAWLNPVPAELGTTFAVLFRGSATADLTDTYVDNTKYTLTFTQFRRDDTPGEVITAELRTGSGDLLESIDFDAVTTTDTYVQRELTYTTNGGTEIGDTIRLVLLDTNGGGSSTQVAIDNLVLDATAVPEPSSLALVGLGGLLIARRRRN